jgi:hypothetical protein
MTTRAGNYAIQGPYGSARKRGSFDGNFATMPGYAPVTLTRYKNQGRYVAGGVWESWDSFGAPSSTPPSGHTLTEITYVVLP